METRQRKEWPGDPTKGLAQSLTKLWIILSELCAGLCLQPTHSLTFFCRGFDTADQFNFVPWEKKKKKKKVIKISSPNAVCEPRCNAKD